MKYTNKFGLPRSIVNAVTRDPYSKGDADFSVSEIIDSPRIKALQIEYDALMETDVSDRVFSLFGRAVHQILEWGADDDDTAEERLYLDVDVDGVKVTVSGAMDLQSNELGGVAVRDWKVTTVWAFQAEKLAWQQQLNCYAHLVRNAQRRGRVVDGKWEITPRDGKPVSSIEIGAILRDWTKSKVGRDPSYPQAAIQPLPLPLWTPEEAENYFMERVRLHIRARDMMLAGREPDPCTPEERWMDPPSYAVIKANNKRASAIFPTFSEAKEYVVNRTDGPTLSVEERGSVPKRCEADWCGVAKWCNQYQGELSK